MYKRFFSVLGAASLVLAGCNEDPSGPGNTPCDDFLLSYGQTTGDTVTTTGGVRYIEVESGTGTVPATFSSVATVNFSGYFLRTTQDVDSSCGQSSTALAFHVGTGQITTGGLIIEGFPIGVLGMRVGGVRRVIIPAELAFGTVEESNHPLAGEDLIFDLQLLQLQ
jgi:FKBP-type peptidyl-prolyl cis-trans isomerase FkpA